MTTSTERKSPEFPRGNTIAAETCYSLLRILSSFNMPWFDVLANSKDRPLDVIMAIRS
jgi:hypothetical protein